MFTQQKEMWMLEETTPCYTWLHQKYPTLVMRLGRGKGAHQTIEDVNDLWSF